MSEVTLVTPGTRLGEARKYTAGAGTYVLNNYVYASIVGVLLENADDSKQPTLTVKSNKPTTLVPEIGNIVTCRVTKINSRMAMVSILTVADQLLHASFQGSIRTRDVRSFEVDQVEIYKCFRPGDIVRAIVISLGDARSYYLGTARNDLGVISATGRAGVPMIPLSWEVMQCPVTLAKEFRKVAKLTAENGDGTVGDGEGEGVMDVSDEAAAKAREGMDDADEGVPDGYHANDNDNDEDEDEDDGNDDSAMKNAD